MSLVVERSVIKWQPEVFFQLQHVQHRQSIHVLMDSSFLLLSSLFSLPLISNFYGYYLHIFSRSQVAMQNQFLFVQSQPLVYHKIYPDCSLSCFWLTRLLFLFVSPPSPSFKTVIFLCEYWVRLHINHTFSITDSTFHSNSLSGKTQNRILRSIALPSTTGDAVFSSGSLLKLVWCTLWKVPFGYCWTSMQKAREYMILTFIYLFIYFWGRERERAGWD